MSRVYWDSMLFIYWIESNPQFGKKVDRLFQKMLARGDELCTSMFTIGEVLVGPTQTQDRRLLAAVEGVFNQGSIAMLPITREATRVFASIRATTRVAPADAIHLSCAAAYGVDYFLTNDRTLRRHQIPGIGNIDDLDVKLP